MGGGPDRPQLESAQGCPSTQKAKEHRGEAVASECTGAGPGGAPTARPRNQHESRAEGRACAISHTEEDPALSSKSKRRVHRETFWHGKFGDQKTVQKVGTGKITGNNERRGEEIYSYICGRLPVPVAAWLKPTNHRAPSHYFAVTS